MSGWAGHEREATTDALAAVGADARTLCAGWTAADLAAHLYVREHRPDALAGVLGGPLSRYTDRVMASALRVHGFDGLVRALRRPPPWLTVTRLDDAVNVAEFFVHCEDVRRGADPAAAPRDLPDGLQQTLAVRLRRQARLLLRGAPARVRLTSAYGSVTAGARDAADEVEVRGEPGELLLFAFNRKEAARVDLVGSDTAIEALRRTPLGL